jgi:uncharacterized protein YjbJ (UPF0337 family)
MNWDRIQGNWKQSTEKAREQWNLLTDEDFRLADGFRDQFASRIQERYGIACDEAERQLASWQRTATHAWFAPP